MESGRRSAIAIALAVAAFLLSPAAFADQAQPDCRLKRALQLPLTYDEGGRPHIPASINGQDVEMLLDTGAVLTGIGQPTIDALKLESHKVGHVLILGGMFPLDHQVTVDSFAIGSMTSKGAIFAVLPPQLVPPGTAGNMGADFMQSFDVELDFGGNRVALFLPDRCANTNVVYWTSQPYARVPFEFNSSYQIQLPMTVDGKEIDAILDTGSVTSWTNVKAVEEKLGIKPYDPKETPASADAPDPKKPHVMRYPFTTLSFGGVSVSNPVIISIRSSSQTHVDARSWVTPSSSG